LCLAAASVAVEAAWSVLGEIGGLLASGVILAVVAWMPGIALRPYWNPFFGAVWFLAAVALAWAVMSGHRKWWPALVISASIAAQAHLMFAVASAGLAVAALIAAVAGRSRAGRGYRWLVAGLLAGLACWAAPLYQELRYSPGNMSALIHAQDTGRHTAGLAFAAKALAAFTGPAPLWWHRHLFQRRDVYRLIEARPAGVAVAVLAVTVAVLLLAVFTLRSRWLASLAAVSLLVSLAAAVTFSGVPADRRDFSRLSYLILALFPAGLLAWLTAGAAIAVTGWRLVRSRRRAATSEVAEGAETPASKPGASLAGRAAYGARAAAAALIVLASLLGLTQVSGYSGAGLPSDQVGTAARRIERVLPGLRMIALSVTAHRAGERYRVNMGLLWALTTRGYEPDISRLGPARPVPQVAVLIKGSMVIVDITHGPRDGS
jgi:hypothetical protein